MKQSDIQEIIERLFVFAKPLPAHLYQNPKVVQTFLVSPLSASTKKTLELTVPFDIFVHKYTKGTYTLEDTKSKTKIQLRNAGSNQTFAFFMNHAYLGGILGAALKTVDEGLILREDGLYLQKDYPLKPNHSQIIHAEKVTDSFEEILNLFNLSSARILQGFKNKEEYFMYLYSSPFLNHATLKRIRNSSCEFLAEFYDSLKKYGWSIYDSTKLPNIQKFNNHFSSFVYKHFESRYNQKLSYFMNVTVKGDATALISLLKKDFPNADGKMFGKLMAEFKKQFKSKGEYKDYLFVSTHEDIAKNLRNIAIQKSSSL